MFEKYIDYIDVLDEDKRKLKSFLDLLENYIRTNKISKELLELNTEELKNIFEIIKGNPKLQVDMWCVLPSEIVDNSENSSIFEAVLDNKFGEYLQGIDKKTLVEVLNSSRTETYVVDAISNQIIFKTVGLLKQMNSPVLDNKSATEALRKQKYFWQQQLFMILEKMELRGSLIITLLQVLG